MLQKIVNGIEYGRGQGRKIDIAGEIAASQAWQRLVQQANNKP
jgi:dsRNA-specific ribonuclease